jgi:hypothetical protein
MANVRAVFVCMLVALGAAQHQHWQRRADGTLAPMKDFTFAAFDADRPLLEQFLQFPAHLDFYRFVAFVVWAEGVLTSRCVLTPGSTPYPSTT